MVSWLPHAVIPGLLALAFFRHVPRRTILATLPIVWAVDLDYLVPHLHRAVTHSTLGPAALLVAVILLWRRGDPTARFWEYATRPGAPAALTMLAYFWASHLLLDVFVGGVVLFWPIWNQNFYLEYHILVDTSTNEPQPSGAAGTEPGAPEVSPVYEWFSYEHTAYLVFLAACAATWLGVWAWRRWRGTLPPKPVVVLRQATLLRPIQKP